MAIIDKNYGFSPRCNGYYDPTNQLRQYLLDRTAVGENNELCDKARSITPEIFEKRREFVRSKFIDALGGLDYERTPLNPVYTGEFDFEGFTLKKVYFESRPGVYVTANLYVPHDLRKPNPAVLMTCGHANEGKASEKYQQVAIDLANNGLIVLIIDPIGQGERLQYRDYDENGKYELVSCTYEHTYLGEQLAVSGANIAGFMVWDLMRAVDFLESLDIVDNTKIGMTGNSGGGTQTAYMMLCETRFAAAMPCCYITNRLDYMKTGQRHDAEQNVFNVIGNGINYDDLVTGMAPKPIRLGCARYDFFCIESAVKTFNKAQKVYELYGKRDDASMVIAEATHGFSPTLRQGAVNFFRKYLLGLDESFVADPDRPVFTREQITVTPTGGVLDLDGFKHIHDYSVEYLDKVRYTETDDIDELRSRVLEVLNLPQPIKDRGEVSYPRVQSDTVIEGIRVRKMFFFTEQDIICTGVLLSNAGEEPTHCTVYVTDNSTEEIFANRADIEKLLERGAVFVFDPRGTGAVKCRPISQGEVVIKYGPIFGDYYKLNCDAVMLGTSLYALRVFDILRARDLMAGYFKFESVSFAGRDHGASDALTAAVVLKSKAVVFGDIYCYEDVVRTKYHASTARHFVHGMLRKYDIPLLAKVLEAERF